MSIRLSDLTKSFGPRAAVDAIGAQIETGEFFAIVGASGCGKSTLLRLVAGLEVADGGEIALGGRVVAGPELHLPPEARGVGFVFQSYALWPHLDVRGNVAFPAETAGMGRRAAARHAEAQLATVGLSEYAARKPAELSGGQRQRVALARCLAQGAKTILMDEPLANLDPHLRQVMEEELVSFHRASGATTLYITHDQREAMAVADRMAVMQAGRFLQVGTPAEIYARPTSEAVARFIGQGALMRVLVERGTAWLAGQPLPLTGDLARAGSRLALLRPADLAPCAAGTEGAFAARVGSALYRGGHWEARLALEGVEAPVLVHLPQPVRAGEALGLRVTGGWLIPA